MKLTPDVWNFYIPPTRVWGNVYYVGTRAVSSHLIDTGEGLILLDSGYAQTLYLVMDGIRQLGFSPYDIKYIVHSHGHHDHTAGTRALVELTGAKTFIGRQDASVVTGERVMRGHSALQGTFIPDVLLDDGDEIRLGNTCIRCMHLPGHTEGVMGFFFDATDGKRTFRAGTHGGVGLNTLSRKYMELNGLPLSLQEDFLKGLERCRSEHVVICLGNHPEQVGEEERLARVRAGETDAFLDDTVWPAFLDRREEMTRRMIAEERAQG